MKLQKSCKIDPPYWHEIRLNDRNTNQVHANRKRRLHNCFSLNAFELCKPNEFSLAIISRRAYERLANSAFHLLFFKFFKLFHNIFHVQIVRFGKRHRVGRDFESSEGFMINFILSISYFILFRLS